MRLAAALLLLFTLANSPSLSNYDDQRFVHTYASQANDVDAVNTHWFETAEGVVVVDTQRLLPEAERAIAHVRATTTRPVIAIFITHPHTDHYGGLPAWVAQWPDAQVYADAVTVRSVVEDSKGYNAARLKGHGARFATQSDLSRAVAKAKIVQDGDRLMFGGLTFLATVFGPSEAERTLVLSSPVLNFAFVGDLVNVGAPAVPFESLSNWIEQLDVLATAYDGGTIYQGHGKAPAYAAELNDQRRFLIALESSVRKVLSDGKLSLSEREDVVFALEGRWPFYMGVAGNTRREMLAFDADLVAKQMGATVE